MIADSLRRKRSRAGFANVFAVPAAVAGGLLWVWSAATAQLLIFSFTAVVVAAVAPSIIFVGSLAAAFAQQRVAAGAVDVSMADLVLLLGTTAAILSAPPMSWRPRKLAVGAAVFFGLLFITVAASPSEAGAFEWLHRVLLVLGAVAVGVAATRGGAIRSALTAFQLVAVVFAARALIQALASGFEPAYPFGLQKNSAGLLLAFAILTLAITPKLSLLPPSLLRLAQALLLVGLMCTRSRGAMVALVVVFVLSALPRAGRSSRSIPIVLVGVAALVVVVYTTTESELELNRSRPELERFRGIGARVETNERAIEIWKGSPIVGEGMRYFRDSGYGIIEPHNVVLHTLTEGGLVGLAGLAVLLGSAFASLRNLRGPVATLARLALIMRLTAALFDIYWVAGTGSIPWILVGVALAGDDDRRAQVA